MKLHTKDSMTATCNAVEEDTGRKCEFTGSLAALELHLHDWDDEEQYPGGRCEDYPCCGHTDGDGCRPLPSHTSEFYYRNPHLMHEPGSPEWHDAMDDYYRDEDEDD